MFKFGFKKKSKEKEMAIKRMFSGNVFSNRIPIKYRKILEETDVFWYVKFDFLGLVKYQIPKFNSVIDTADKIIYIPEVSVFVRDLWDYME